MTAREKFEAGEKKSELLTLYPICRVCNEEPSTQLAHRIPKSKAMLKKYGTAVIHHRKNFVPVCGLKCNAAVNIQGKPMEINKLVKIIKEKI